MNGKKNRGRMSDYIPFGIDCVSSLFFVYVKSIKTVQYEISVP